MWYIHITEYYLVIKKNKVLTYAITWINPESILLNESQLQKPTHFMILLIYKSPNREIYKVD
jgi:hypothetical protein